MLRKLSAYPRQNGLAVSLRELGQIERTLFTPKWLQDPVLRRRVSAGLNKGEALNSLARAVFFYRRDAVTGRPLCLLKCLCTSPVAIYGASCL